MSLYLTSVGCRLNQAEMDDLGQRALAAGLTLVGSAQDCDLAVVNTCSVTAAAASDSRSAAARIHRLRPDASILLTGCWATLDRARAAQLSGVSTVVPNEAKDRILAELTDRSRPGPAEPEVATPERRTRPVIKVLDGCNHHCTYCAAAIARGPARSLPLRSVVERVQRAEAEGALEVILTGVQLGAYGRELPGPLSLAGLLETLLRETRIQRLRLSSLEPWSVNDRLLELWRDRRMCPQLHLPVQSGCAETLRRMGRPITPSAFEKTAALARQAIPGLALTTDVMVGFPGETHSDFEASMAFIERHSFARMHVFTFSPRPGTPAARLPHRVPSSIARQRADLARRIAEHSEREFAAAQIGELRRVLWETPRLAADHGWRLSGLTEAGLRVVASYPASLHNTFSLVRLSSLEQNGTIRGQVLASPPCLAPDGT